MEKHRLSINKYYSFIQIYSHNYVYATKNISIHPWFALFITLLQKATPNYLTILYISIDVCLFVCPTIHIYSSNNLVNVGIVYFFFLWVLEVAFLADDVPPLEDILTTGFYLFISVAMHLEIFLGCCIQKVIYEIFSLVISIFCSFFLWFVVLHFVAIQ